ncbi:hypothetical protein ACH3O9_13245 [Leeuwenhoekiella sp. A16]|uniref:hypothetical protein n=1 Tax=unclassified Leeuwenhoekiella TaxID=2615029 RepID=UPI003A808A80
MHRREAIKSLALASIAAMVMTRCDLGEEEVTDFLSKGKLNLDDKHKDYLAQISETFLPLQSKVDKITPPEDFIMTMVNDCSSEEDIAKFARGFNDYKNLMNESKLEIETEKPEAVINVVQGVLDKQEPEESQENLIYFINTVRGQSLRNLTTSAFYMQGYMDYELIPSEYIACYDISTIKA